jgi:hypothetical protein
MITPSNGRIVWFTPARGANAIERISQHDPLVPLAAMVCHVWGDRMVNLDVVDSDGRHHAITSVVLLQDDDPKPEDGRFAQWMPYQKGQAAKTEALEAEKSKS